MTMMVTLATFDSTSSLCCGPVAALIRRVAFASVAIVPPQRHSREGGKPSMQTRVVHALDATAGPRANVLNLAWIPACAGMTEKHGVLRISGVMNVAPVRTSTFQRRAR